MRQSLAMHGQLTPVIVVERGGRLEIVDGFKRRAAAATMRFETLWASQRELDDQGVWVAMLTLNRGPGSMTVIEEALILREMAQGGASQTMIAQMLGRHPSWVSRRIGLVERLHPELLEWVRTGLLPAGTARRLIVLPQGTQAQFAAVVSKASLGTTETEALVSLWQKTADPSIRRALLAQPRQALEHTRPADLRRPADPRLAPRSQALQRWLQILAGVGPRIMQGLRPAPPPHELEILGPDLRAVERMLPDLTAVVGSASRSAPCGASAATSGTP
jgi:ParB/RepB/Spo0J family partition protein